MAQREADLNRFAVAVGSPPSGGVAGETAQPEHGAPTPDDDLDISSRERQLILWLTNVSHGVNHFQGQMLTPLLSTVIMTDLGFSFVFVGLISAINNIIMNGSQFLYGFVTPFVQRTRLLGIGYIVMCAGTMLTGLSTSWGTLVGARVIMGLGGSGQHPVGASLLSSYFPKRRGSILALNSTIANVGTMLAPVVAAVAVTAIGWRHLMFLVAIPSVLIGVAYLFVKDRQRTQRTDAPKRAVLASSFTSYRRALRNRNMMIITIVFAVGAAGRGGQGVQLYLAPHLMRDFGMSLAFAGAALTISQAGGLVGPIALGWLSDKLSRPAVLQASLLASFITTQWLARQGPEIPMLVLSLVLFGAFVSSRNTLTQALVADSVEARDQDAAFSIYFTLGFVAGPIMAIIEGILMQRFGFTTMFSWTSLT
ncbi:MAG TPA: MFS transporter, partial [Dehalococcoidia bacterium]|nr:MFS transporter [Dehalococcoidia bacterium]